METALEAYDKRPAVFRPEDPAVAGAFVSIDGSGKLRVERGYVRHEDEVPVAHLLEEDAVSGDGGATAQNGDSERNGVDQAGFGTGAGAT